MPRFTRILAITDFSEAARAAVLRAGRIARCTNATLHILHVVQAPPLDQLRNLLSDPPADLRERLLAAAQFQLEELAHAVQAEHGVTATLRAAEGRLMDEIGRAQRESGADLTVLGARGSSVARHLLLGSTADRLLASATHPMLAVRLPAEVPYRRVLVPVDFSERSPVALECAQALVAPGGRVTALHAYEAAYEGKLRVAGVDDRRLRGYVQAAEGAARQQMDELLAQAGGSPPAVPLLLHGHPVAHALDQEEELGCQLLVVAQGSGNRTEDMLVGSVSRRLLVQSRVDVLLAG